jgi:RimJ/RimL family protein N-acetyltransferase
VVGESLQLRPFDPLYASAVASWVRGEAELLWLAPGTAWPLTAAKVVGWTRPTDRPVLLFEGAQCLPCGYAELNPLRDLKTQLWIGHLVIDPTRRGGGLGQRFTRMLLAEAFAAPWVERAVMIVFPDNEAALRCYEACGFRVTRREQHRFPPHRRHHSLLRMEITRAQVTPPSADTATQKSPA